MIWLVRLTETDGECQIVRLDSYQDFVKQTEHMDHEDFALIKGEILKDFGSKKDYKKIFEREENGNRKHQKRKNTG